MERDSGTHLLLSAFITGTLYRLSSFIVARIDILHVVNTPRGAIDPRHGNIPFATLQAIRRGHRERRMIHTRHYGTYDSRSIISSYGKVQGLDLRPAECA